MGGGSRDNETSAYSGGLTAFIEEAPLERRSIADFVAAAAAGLPAGSRVADIGAGGSPYRELFRHAEYVSVDHEISAHADAAELDVVGSADDLPLDDESFDAVLCTQVLEHLAEPARALAEMHRVLRPGGRLFLTAPLVWEEHEQPHDYFRYTSSGLDHLLRSAGFAEIAITPRTDAFTTLAQLIENARWSLGVGSPETASDERREAYERLGRIAAEVHELSPLDARGSFPLGFTVSAVRPAGDRPLAAGAERAQTSPAEVGRERIPVLYLAPWVDLGGSDKGTIDWFKHIDRERWAPSIITTQPSPNRWLHALEPYAQEVWSLPDLMPGSEFPSFILGFIESRGVKIVHIMNSRLAFDLLPDMTCLPDPPSIVVQLHAEEPDRSGYVRYVSSRYGNLVDAFSVTSRQLAEAMRDYEIPRSRLHVITTGVDAVEEFDPQAVEPFEELSGEGPRILWPGRLVAQKDPHLTLDVVRILRERDVRFTMHVVGDGDLESEVRERATELGLDDRIRWHPPSHEMPRWYRSCDVLLMTSVFEGVPYVMYEAQAMGMPIVVPALAGNAEFLAGAPGGTLIDPRDDAAAYADALQALLEDDGLREETGRRARERMLRDFSLPEMGRRHDELYEQRLTRASASSRRIEAADALLPAPATAAALPAAVRLPREPLPERSVAVIVPCYEHGRFLPAAIDSLRAQTLAPRRVIVVDDGSTDSETHEVLDRLDQDAFVTVLRLARNGGPSVARNRALALVQESYVLPLDADDLLLPTALEQMAAQLEAAPEDVGFVYPNVQHFGNRNDYWEAPAYNLHMLLANNYCAATTLFDRRVFDAGIAYPEEIVFGHEDWDLILQLAERSIRGVPAIGPTFKYRKLGFSRVNAVEYGPAAFHEAIVRRHPALFARRDQVKGRWAPALSLVLLDGVDGTGERWPDELPAWLDRQVCRDFEVIADAALPSLDADEHAVTSVGGEGTERVRAAVSRARGRWVLLAGPASAGLLSRPAFVEQLLRAFWSGDALGALAIARFDARRTVPLTPLSGDEARRAQPLAVAWSRPPDEPAGSFDCRGLESGVADLVAELELTGLQWRSG